MSVHLQQISQHAEAIYPEECCGLLLGTVENELRTLIEVRETNNNWSKVVPEFLANPPEKVLSKRNRFSIAPEILLKVQKEVRDRNLSIIGIYHSHPDAPAVPSQSDRALAWPQYSYLIVSVQQGKAKEINSWQLDDNQQFQAEIIRILA